MQNVTVHLKDSKLSVLSKTDDYVRVPSNQWFDSLEVSSLGFETMTIALKKKVIFRLNIHMNNKPGNCSKSWLQKLH